MAKEAPFSVQAQDFYDISMNSERREDRTPVRGHLCHSYRAFFRAVRFKKTQQGRATGFHRQIDRRPRRTNYNFAKKMVKPRFHKGGGGTIYGGDILLFYMTEGGKVIIAKRPMEDLEFRRPAFNKSL